MPRRVVGLLSMLVLVAGGGIAAAAAGGSAAPAGLAGSLADRCVALQAPNGRFVSSNVGAPATRRAHVAQPDAAAFFVKPTGLGTVLLFDRSQRLLGRAGGRRVGERRPSR